MILEKRRRVLSGTDSHGGRVRLADVAIIENSPFPAGYFRRFLDEEGAGHRTFPVWRGSSRWLAG